MSTKLNKAQVNPEFRPLFSFATGEEKIRHQSEMISLRILSEVERICEERKWKKKDLAEKVGTSRSYITQLFRGSRQVNTYIMAKFEDALDFTFEIKIRPDEESQEDFLAKQLPAGFFTNRNLDCGGYKLYLFNGGSHKDKTLEMVNEMKAENKNVEAA